ncbi:ubiquinone/menaquinone biosynthesis C-methylase UbiE [Arthrobacter pigmenti]|uniref:Ubiquinone/menaquinone biosynthesis C-methylase UbiE n=1 Tax=Arthrobacter pigmenti TaxID=271432 RepID=A0A846RTI9_9MICC|nr:methyltransferase domain-containing protein [Arthrobacter pigmenti]NJC23487.1 ubiquinone/menaquinone biosynthesis C-methylase UbiE [Arthrobacter pigmenti]
MSEEVYSHGHHSSVTSAHSERRAADSAGYLLDHLTSGMDLLDVGCGPGSITADFAALLDPGRVIGMDRSAEVVALAERTYAGIDNLSFRTGNVYDLDLPDESVDVVHAHQVLQHLTDPVAALREMRRVTRPGGVIAVREADFHAIAWYPPTPELDEWMDTYQQLARSNRAEPDAGRHLLAWAHEAGLTDVEASSSNWLYATPERRRRHAAAWAERVLSSAFAEQTLDRGLSDRAALERMAAGWRRWGESTDGWFLIPCGEILVRV